MIFYYKDFLYHVSRAATSSAVRLSSEQATTTTEQTTTTFNSTPTTTTTVSTTTIPTGIEKLIGLNNWISYFNDRFNNPKLKNYFEFFQKKLSN